MEIRNGSVFFPASRGHGPQERVAAPIVFPREVRQAVVGVTGYSAGFSGKDHEFGRLIVQVQHQVTFNTVSVTVTFGLRDWSHEWDDSYTGLVNFAVLADLATAGDAGTRPDLTITDAETTQVTQHFRSSTFLDPLNVRPDNSIPLIAGKATAVRLWVDHTPDPALPPLSFIGGQLEVVSGTGTIVVPQMEFIQPRRESLILRSERTHTLNFVIPETACTGVVTLRARANSSADPTQRSAVFERTIRFVDVAPLRLHLVGVEDASVDPPRTAPSYMDMRTLLARAEQWYPYGEIADTGYEVLRTTYNYEGNVAQEEPAGWDDLLDDLSDLRGDSPEIYVAQLPNGTPTGDVGGLSNFSDAGAFAFGNASGAAHEIGHCLGREHPPCPTCSPPPADPDWDFPQYGPFGRDSIGEFGFDIVGNRVLHPANTFDFMGYSNPEWISPHTYKGLSGNQDLFALAAAAARGRQPPGPRGNWQPAAMEALYLQLSIARDRTVSRRHSFHYPVVVRSGGRQATPFSVELHDDKGRVLVCTPLFQSGASTVGGCGDRCGYASCWPVRVRDMIPYPPGARRLVVYEDRTAIHEEVIPAPPVVHITDTTESADGIMLTWTASAAGSRGDLWYLLQYEDEHGLWRGVARRTSETQMLLPTRRFPGRALKVRVLASSGIATGRATAPVTMPSLATPPSAGIVAVGLERGALPRFLIAKVEREGMLSWFDEQGAALSQGAMLDLGSLPQGESLLRVVWRGKGMLEERVWIVTRKGDEVVAIQELEGSRHADRP